MRARSFSEGSGSGGDDTPAADSGTGESSSPEFEFDGFKVVFAEKVMLTPVASTTPAVVLAQAQSRRYH
jgi:hypothetical protein